MRRIIALQLFAVLLFAPSGHFVRAADAKKLPLPVPRKVDFAKDVYPIFKESCISCHGPEKQKGKYRLDTKAGAFKEVSGGPAIVPGNSEKSPLILMVAGLVEDGLMPPPSDKPGESQPLNAGQIGILRAWIDQGAVWPDGPIADVEKKLVFTDDVQPILKTACIECHGMDQPKGGFRVDSRDALLKGGKSYGASVLPNNTAKSPLAIIAAGLDEDIPLPARHKLPAKELGVLKKWIEQGAN
jgi:mono/diheme cytochrome c family protein